MVQRIGRPFAFCRRVNSLSIDNWSQEDNYPPAFAFLMYFSNMIGTWSARDVAVDFVVDHHDGSQAAGAQAAGGFEGEDAVLAGFAPGMPSSSIIFCATRSAPFT